MTIDLSLSPEMEAELRERAAAAGVDLATFIREAVEGLIDPGKSPNAASNALSPQKWSEQWRRWAESYAPINHVIHDDREDLYAGRGE